MNHSKYQNPDGTFKGGFDGCVAHMMEVEGHSKDSATKICGYIAEQKMGNRANLPLFNRDASGNFALPTDGWFHIVPVGEFPHPESGLIQVIDDQAIQAMVNRFSQDSAAPNFPGLLVDFEHFSYDTSKPSNAAGWVTEIQNRADGIWGKIRWSTDGQKAIEGGSYRLISPAWLPNQVQPLGNKRIRPLRLDTAGLTNNPNLRGMVPLSNRDTPSGASSEKPNQQINTSKMKQINTALGLSADASEEAALAELNKLMKRLNDAESAEAPLNNRVKELETANTELTNRNKALLDVQIEADLVKYANRFKPEAKDKWKAQLLANRASALELLESLPEVQADANGTNAAGTAAGAMHNRAQTKTPSPAGQVDVQKSKDEAKAKKIANRAKELIKGNPSLNFPQAWRAAEGEFAAE